MYFISNAKVQKRFHLRYFSHIFFQNIGYTQLLGMLTYIVIGGQNKNCHNCNVTLLVRVNPKRLKVYITGYQHFKSSDPAFHGVARIGRSG